MKRQLISFLFVIGVSLSLYAVPAKPGKTKVTQPDGSTVTLVLHGDEFRHFTTTADNYTVVETPAGYQYAVKVSGKLVASGITAHDDEARTAEEKEFLQGVSKNLCADMTQDAQQFMARSRSMWKTPAQGTPEPQKARYNYENFRGLVLLIEWNDKSFTRTDANAFFSSMINDENYAGYNTQGTPQQWVECTGSVRDYFSDNSFGLFKPTFDVVGPIKINRSCTYPQGTSRVSQCIIDAIQAANAQVDFSQYDADNNGEVDMFYIIFAGHGSNVQGNNSNYVWPHASYYPYYYVTYDGKRMGRYACSTEMTGYEGHTPATLDGIGTICHEFSHVLGLPDLYDTDYEVNGQSNDPGDWSVMSGGSYLNNSRTPVGYNAYERYAAGFMMPELIKEQGKDYTLGALNETNRALRINSAINKEYFLIENRQQTKWDTYLPGSGMLIARVDSTNASVWNNNTVNANPDHNYFELLRATPNIYGTTIIPSKGDPFPGIGNVTMVNNETEPSLRSWTGAATPLSLYNIKSTDGVISFTVGGPDAETGTEDFEAMEQNTADVTGVKGAFCNWNLTGARILPTTETAGSQTQALGLYRNAKLISSAMTMGIFSLEFDVWNTTRTQSIIVTSYSTDGGTTWTRLANTSGQNQLRVAAGNNVHTKFIANIPANVMLKIEQTSGLPNEATYIDNIDVMFVPGTTTGIGGITAENGEMTAVEGVYNISGQRVEPGTKGILIIKGRTADGRMVTRKVIRR